MILLASRSPQRRALLGALGVEFRVVVSGVDEGADPVANARAKAEDVAARAIPPLGPGDAVIGADTEVLLDGRALGKAADRGEAEAMLRALSGRVHSVVSAVFIRTPATTREVADETRVTFRPLSEGLLRWYLDAGEWRERAGAYAIQGAGAALVERIEGSYATVVGLPVAALGAALEDLGLAPWVSPAVR
ncbi:MAG TPA: Maf family protein [Miltoncostaeaceae bacterium]|nr:Maf family protein [Miltoncostaeaceae bacterium]